MAGIGLALSLASSIIPSIAQGITGGKQKREAERLRKSTTRPTYETPMSAKKMQGIAEQQATQGLVGRSILEDRLRGSTAGAVRATGEVATSPASRLAAITATYGKEMEGMEDIAMADTQARLEAANRLSRAYGAMADYEDKEFAVNKQAPFEDTMAAASALTGAGMQNVQGSLEGISRAGAAALSGLGEDDEEDGTTTPKKKKKAPAITPSPSSGMVTNSIYLPTTLRR
jgi:hypothetical protein